LQLKLKTKVFPYLLGMDSTYTYEKNQESREKQQKLFSIFLAWTQLI